MNISNQTKLLLFIAAILLFILFYYNYYNKPTPVKNEGYSNTDEKIVIDNTEDEYNLIDDVAIENEIPKNDLVITDNLITDEINVSECNTPECNSEKNIMRKFKSKNRAKPGEYKKINYAEGTRGNDSAEFDAFFNDNNEMVNAVYASDDTFSPNDETHGNLASYNPGKKDKLSDEDIFKAENYLPQEQNKDWFEVMPDPISVKNRHLINISRPIGINTIGTTLRNPSYDLRGDGTPNPKYIASPWLQSSIEPDINTRGLC